MIKKIAIIGAGQMGAGIAHVAALAEFDVMLFDLKENILKESLSTIAANMDRQVKKQIITETQKQNALARITPASDLQKLSDADLVIEAIVENEKIKTKLFADLDHITKPETILASNTSSISITSLAASTKRPEKIIGMHFMNPVPVMQLVEMIRGEKTSDQTYQSVCDAAQKMGKILVTSNDRPGFILNRILMPMINEAVYALHENVATAQDIDTGMKLGANHPMGPLALADLIGLDTCVSIMNVLYEGLKNEKYKPCPLLIEKVAANHLGRKTGKGFFDYA